MAGEPVLMPANERLGAPEGPTDDERSPESITTRRRRYRKIETRFGCGVVLLLGLAVSYGFGSPIHYSDPIAITVTDEDTGKPLGDVAGIAVWTLDSFGLPLVLHKTEALSDSNGRLHFDGMPLRIRPPFYWFTIFDPQIFLYKPGYTTALLHNGELAPNYVYHTRAAKRVCVWNGRTVPLPPDRTPEDYLGSYRSASDQPFNSGIHPDRFPKFWRALVRGYQGLSAEQKRHLSSGNPQDDIDYWTSKGRR